MNKYLLILVCSGLLLFQACKKADHTPVPDTSIPENPNPEPEPEPEPENPEEQKEIIIEIQTEFGDMYMWLYKETPLHRDNFLKLANEGFYDNTTFHRIIKGFMIQGGDPNSKDNDPTNDGTGGPGYTIPAEFVDSFKNVRGAVATARIANNFNPKKESSGPQFFINVVNNTRLNGEYTVFGFIIKGIEVADQIVIQDKDPNDRPLKDIKMKVNVLEKTEAELLEEYDFSL